MSLDFKGERDFGAPNFAIAKEEPSVQDVGANQKHCRGLLLRFIG